MRIQIVMSLVGKLLYIFGAFLLIPFIYSIIFETAYWLFAVTATISGLAGFLLVTNGHPVSYTHLTLPTILLV